MFKKINIEAVNYKSIYPLMTISPFGDIKQAKLILSLLYLLSDDQSMKKVFNIKAKAFHSNLKY